MEQKSTIHYMTSINSVQHIESHKIPITCSRNYFQIKAVL